MGNSEKDDTFKGMIGMTFGWMAPLALEDTFGGMIWTGETKEKEVSRAKDGFAGERFLRWMDPFGIGMKCRISVFRFSADSRPERELLSLSLF